MIVFVPPQSSKSLRKTATRHLLSYRLEIKGLGIYFAKDPYRPQVSNSPVYIEVINFCGSQPCSPSREQRYYGLIELKPRTYVRRLFKILQASQHLSYPTVANFLEQLQILQMQSSSAAFCSVPGLLGTDDLLCLAPRIHGITFKQKFFLQCSIFFDSCHFTFLVH